MQFSIPFSSGFIIEYNFQKETICQHWGQQTSNSNKRHFVFFLENTCLRQDNQIYLCFKCTVLGDKLCLTTELLCCTKLNSEEMQLPERSNSFWHPPGLLGVPSALKAETQQPLLGIWTRLSPCDPHEIPESYWGEPLVTALKWCESPGSGRVGNLQSLSLAELSLKVFSSSPSPITYEALHLLVSPFPRACYEVSSFFSFSLSAPLQKSQIFDSFFLLYIWCLCLISSFRFQRNGASACIFKMNYSSSQPL